MEQQQPAAPDPLIGLTIGNYEIKHKLGEGGMGSVYLAEHPLIGKKVALKVLHAEFASNRDVVARFFTEAKSVNDIQHPNIVDIVDYGEIVQPSGNMVYFIMEFLDGVSLSDLIRQEAPFAPERALSISMQIADCLAQSHQHGIVHRDLKPDNVILINRARQTDFVKVLDFGIAKLTGDQPGSRRTRTGIVLGTPAYMSPEQCEGRGNVDHRTDIYALGILLYEMLTGRVPFQGEGYGEVLVQHLTQAPVRPTTIRGVIPPHVEVVCMKALEKRIEDRYTTMDDFMKGLADPVGFVEANGGLEGFAKSDLSGAYNTPGPSLGAPTPSPVAPLTPAPGALSPVTQPTPTPAPTAMTPAGGQIYTPPPGTLSPVPGQLTMTTAAGGSRMPLIIGAVIVALGLAGGGFFLLKGDSDESVAGTTDPDQPDPDQPDPDQPDPDQPDPDQPEPDQPDPEVVPDKPEPEVVPDKPEPEVVPDKPVDPPPPPVVEKVTINVVSSPSGAEVYVGRERKSRGVTPFTFEMDKANAKVRVKLKRRGYRDRTTTFVPDKNQDIDLNLRKKRPKPTPTGPSDDDDVLGPSFGRGR